MTAKAVIEEIKHLPPSEQSRLIQFAVELVRNRQLAGEELSALAQRMVESDDPAEVEKLKSALTHGFYGKLSHAPYPAQQPAAGLVCASARPDQNPQHFRRPTWFAGGMTRYQAGSSRRKMVQEIFRYDCLRARAN